MERDGKLIQLAIELKSGDIDSFIEDLRMQRQEQFGLRSPPLSLILPLLMAVELMLFAHPLQRVAVRSPLENILKTSKTFLKMKASLDFMESGLILCGQLFALE